jgi:hypothetical protein
MARTGRYEEDALKKAGVGANRPRVQRRVILMRIIMTAASAEYDGVFRVSTLSSTARTIYVKNT